MKIRRIVPNNAEFSINRSNRIVYPLTGLEVGIIMWVDLTDFLKANSTETFIISVIGTVLVWMYRCISFVYYVDRHIP